jgi:hypothetical protein
VKTNVDLNVPMETNAALTQYKIQFRPASFGNETQTTRHSHNITIQTDTQGSTCEIMVDTLWVRTIVYSLPFLIPSSQQPPLINSNISPLWSIVWPCVNGLLNRTQSRKRLSNDGGSKSLFPQFNHHPTKSPNRRKEEKSKEEQISSGIALLDTQFEKMNSFFKNKLHSFEFSIDSQFYFEGFVLSFENCFNTEFSPHICRFGMDAIQISAGMKCACIERDSSCNNNRKLNVKSTFQFSIGSFALSQYILKQNSANYIENKIQPIISCLNSQPKEDNNNYNDNDNKKACDVIRFSSTLQTELTSWETTTNYFSSVPTKVSVPSLPCFSTMPIRSSSVMLLTPTSQPTAPSSEFLSRFANHLPSATLTASLSGELVTLHCVATALEV